ncbi:AraC family transcriptional regulator [Flavipsychrobacter stenotrophus]|uniref:AraC family transcriptional regulator n=1 Tax=Flavipsychrobacter stenotrophus TaxID=2077091 RepID=A0A2S7SR44_9BACT|nr:AraC family transcriptional regulator [Flavipsychrobacter stenotrophus]PQJ09370.1 AraC family transcriptional regulator [Flavipsychrobacter stenotrophus]
MKLYIKNMVCDRCKMIVRAELEKFGLHPISVNLGEVELSEPVLSANQLNDARICFENLGFELIDDRKSMIIEQVKVAVIEMVHRENNDTKIKHSEYLSQHLNYEYPYLSKTFSDEEGVTIEQFIIQQKTEKIKELIGYGELNFSEIALQMGYSSVAALSSQFKKVMGITPSEYKATHSNDRKSLDRVAKII